MLSSAWCPPAHVVLGLAVPPGCVIPLGPNVPCQDRMSPHCKVAASLSSDGSWVWGLRTRLAEHYVVLLPCSQYTIMQLPTPHVMCYIHMHNHTVTTLPRSQCTIIQSPTSHAPSAQSCSHQPPMLCYNIHMHHHVVPNLPRYVTTSTCTIM